MKAKLILLNWIISFLGLFIDTERSPLWAVLIAVGWFTLSSLLLKYADKKGWMDKLTKQFKVEL